MIIDSFDDKSPALISPKDALSKNIFDIASNYKIDTFIITFSGQLFDELVKRDLVELLDEKLAFGSAAGKNCVYRIPGTNIGVFLSGIGSMMASGMIEELYAVFGCKKFVVFGSCGALVDLPEGRLIIPSEAYRDEGMSYHYVKASDYITIKNSNKLAKVFDELKVDYMLGKVWTTDAFYRETVSNRDARIADECLCVEMECSALQAVCDFRGLDLYHFVYAADSLDGEWTKRILGHLELDHRIAYFYLAKQIVEHIK